MTFEEYVKEELGWEKYRQEHPACDNCYYFYTEYGMPCCKYYEAPMEDFEKDKCEKWI